MGDRELLELAAKAAGVVCVGWAERGDHEWGIADGSSDTMRLWNPLLSGDDALRLAVFAAITLRRVKIGGDGVKMVIACIWGDDGIPVAHCVESLFDGQDHYTATRRAIVRAAAEVGRNIKEQGDGGGV